MKEETCQTKATLLVAYKKAAALYSKAVSELSRSIGEVSLDVIEELTIAAERMRRTSANAREAFEGHLAEHDC
jgi:hypothetical protein